MARYRINSPIFRMLVGTVFFGAFLAGGSYALYKCVTELPLALASQGWPTVDGTVTKSQLLTKRKGRRKHRLRYTYTVDNRLYESNRIGFMDGMFGGNARETYRRYPQGKRVIVYYYPERPSLGVVQPGVRAAAVVGSFVLAGIFIPFGLWGLRASFRSQNRRQVTAKRRPQRRR